MLIKLPLDKINVTNNALFFLSRAPPHYSFTFNSQFLNELNHMVYLSKTVCAIFDFRFLLIFIKVYISFQNKNSRKTTRIFAPRPLIFKLDQEVWKFNDICVSWSSPKTDLQTNILNLENQNFEYITFSQ